MGIDISAIGDSLLREWGRTLATMGIDENAIGDVLELWPNGENTITTMKLRLRTTMLAKIRTMTEGITIIKQK